MKKQFHYPKTSVLLSAFLLLIVTSHSIYSRATERFFQIPPLNQLYPVKDALETRFNFTVPTTMNQQRYLAVGVTVTPLRRRTIPIEKTHVAPPIEIEDIKLPQWRTELGKPDMGKKLENILNLQKRLSSAQWSQIVPEKIDALLLDQDDDQTTFFFQLILRRCTNLIKEAAPISGSNYDSLAIDVSSFFNDCFNYASAYWNNHMAIAHYSLIPNFPALMAERHNDRVCTGHYLQFALEMANILIRFSQGLNNEASHGLTIMRTMHHFSQDTLLDDRVRSDEIINTLEDLITIQGMDYYKNAKASLENGNIPSADDIAQIRDDFMTLLETKIPSRVLSLGNGVGHCHPDLTKKAL